MGGGRWEVGGGRWEVGGGRWEVGGGKMALTCVRYLTEMSPNELKEYDEIVKQTDPDIFAWITGKQQIPDELYTSTMSILSLSLSPSLPYLLCLYHI